VDASSKQAAGVMRLGGYAALMLGASYLLITALYIVVGAVPHGDGQAWLDYLAGKTIPWWWIAGLSVLTDILFLVIAAALLAALRSVRGTAAMVGTGLVALFAILDLAVTWPNFVALITLGADYASAGAARQATLVAAATYPSAVIGSTLFAVYAILVPGIGILAIGLAMRGTQFGRPLAYVAIATGVLAAFAVVGPIVGVPLGSLAIAASVLTTVWVVLVGVALIRMPSA
jgi:hypothetical protein